MLEFIAWARRGQELKSWQGRGGGGNYIHSRDRDGGGCSGGSRIVIIVGRRQEYA